MVHIADLLFFITPPLFSAVALAALHWFPWRNGAADLTRLEAYTAGTLIVVGVPVASMLLAYAMDRTYGELFWALLLIANTVASGVTVQVAYWYDGRRAIDHADVHHARSRH